MRTDTATNIAAIALCLIACMIIALLMNLIELPIGF